MLKNVQLRDWLIIAAIVAAAGVLQWRVAALEQRFDKFEVVYARADNVDLKFQLVNERITTVNERISVLNERIKEK